MTGFNCVVQFLHLSLFSYIANLIIASVQIAACRGGLDVGRLDFCLK